MSSSSRTGQDGTPRSCASFPVCGACDFSRIDRCIPAEAEWDGLGETWFDTIADSDRAFLTEPFKAMLIEDREIFIGEAHSCYVEEPTGFGPPDPASA